MSKLSKLQNKFTNMYVLIKVGLSMLSEMCRFTSPLLGLYPPLHQLLFVSAIHTQQFRLMAATLLSVFLFCCRHSGNAHKKHQMFSKHHNVTNTCNALKTCRVSVSSYSRAHQIVWWHENEWVLNHWEQHQCWDLAVLVLGRTASLPNGKTKSAILF